MSDRPVPVVGEPRAIYRNGLPVYIDSSGYLMTPSGSAYGSLPGRFGLYRGPDGDLEIRSIPSSVATNLMVTVVFAAVLAAFPAVIAFLVQPQWIRLGLIAVATLTATVILVVGVPGSFSRRGPLHGYNPLVRWDPGEQLLTFDGGRVRIAKDEVQSIVYENRCVRWYHNTDASVFLIALWIKVNEGEYVGLPLGLLSGRNQAVVREFLKALPFN